MTAEPLRGERVELRAVRPEDAEPLRAMRRSPSIYRWWGGHDEQWPFDDPDTVGRTVWHEGLIGYVQWYENRDERYLHAGIDLFLADQAQGRGLGRETVSLVLQQLLAAGHHRIVIDPAADNERAIACYAACGFTVVGTMRKYERDNDGQGWHDGLLMEYVKD